MTYVDQLAASKNKVDKRFMNLYIYRKAAQRKIRYGYENNILFKTNKRKVSNHNDISSQKMMESVKLPSEFIETNKTYIEEAKSTPNLTTVDQKFGEFIDGDYDHLQKKTCRIENDINDIFPTREISQNKIFTSPYKRNYQARTVGAEQITRRQLKKKYVLDYHEGQQWEPKHRQ